MPVNAPGAWGVQPSLVVAGVPVLASGRLPLVGAGGAAVALV